MAEIKDNASPEELADQLQAALIRLERAALDRVGRPHSDQAGQAAYIARLESDNRQMQSDMAQMKQHCLALKASYDLLDEKYRTLENMAQSTENELATMVRDIDQLLIRQSLPG